jgi:hypothetical protein
MSPTRGVHRHDVVLAALEFLKQGAREILRVAGNTDHRQALFAQKFLNLCKCRHGPISV